MYVFSGNKRVVGPSTSVISMTFASGPYNVGQSVGVIALGQYLNNRIMLNRKSRKLRVPCFTTCRYMFLEVLLGFL